MNTLADKPADEPFTDRDLLLWPLAIGAVDLQDGLLVATARRPGGFTVDDLEAIPEDGRRYELLDGVVVVSPAPVRAHQRMVLRLGAALLAAEVPPAQTLIAPYDVQLSLTRRLQPDLLVVPHADAPVPTLVVEVLSASTRRYDRVQKRQVYEQAAIASYWLLDPDAVAMEVLELTPGGYAEAARVSGDEEWTATLPFPVTVCPSALLR